ncbi:MAG: cysteine peptidase family C39 domain-containing protein [Candidatus Hydrogenedentes bacterium]|nr:cysteine peptidase family C39 domain-containing protein [Candidatus Hydrogenedentota bacterium]
MLELPLAISILTALVAGVLGVRHGRTLFLRGFRLAGSVRVRDCALIPTCMLLFLVAHVTTSTVTGNPRIAWMLPVFVEYYLIPALWILKILFATFAMAAIATVGFLERHSIRIPLIVFSVIVIVVIDGLIRASVQPNLGDISDMERDGVVLQSNPSTCAAATAANIARKYGIEMNEADMITLMNTTWAGTSPAQLVHGFRSLGLKARKVFHSDRDLSKVHAPAVLFVEVGGEPDAHAVAFMGRVGDEFEICDPNGGRRNVSGETIGER